MDNDCNAFAIGALHKGIIPDRSVAFHHPGTGIAGCVISEGKILYANRNRRGVRSHDPKGGRKEVHVRPQGLLGKRTQAVEALISFYDGRTEPKSDRGESSKR
ncbi:MAG: hypothetical protein MZU95_05650 [Desulfomicrobium escambiense]|nr:hypothetical protein [Desulfomicrobium escambiense]